MWQGSCIRPVSTDRDLGFSGKVRSQSLLIPLHLIRRRRKMANPSAHGGHTGKSQRGFASMDREKQRQIASKGGHAAHEKGTAHEFTPEEARAAGRKGGEVVSRDRAHMAAIGREGGQRSHRNRAARAEQRTLKESEPPQSRQEQVGEEEHQKAG
jgi:general stress protein YciG